MILGLTGFAGSGKSTAADHLEDTHGFVRVSFATPLKRMLRTFNPILHDWPSDPYTPPSYIRLSKALELLNGDETALKKSKWGKHYRECIQDLGTECVRAEDETFWVRAAERQLTNPNANYVFDDCRFPNEAQFIKDIDPRFLWNVQRPGVEAVNGHTSEQWAGKLGERFHIVNDKDIADLRVQIDMVLSFVELAAKEGAAA